MTLFQFEILTDQPDTAYVRIDKRFDIAMVHTPEDLELRVYPISNGEVWTCPYDTFTVNECDIVTAEGEMEG